MSNAEGNAELAAKCSQLYGKIMHVHNAALCQEL